jgi:hypothetical protein
MQTDPSGGIGATTVQDTMRVATALAVDQAFDRQPDRDVFRARAAAILDEHEERAGWRPHAVTIDGAPVQGLVRVLPEGTWAVVAELNDSYLAAAGPTEIPPATLAFVAEPSDSR